MTKERETCWRPAPISHPLAAQHCRRSIGRYHGKVVFPNDYPFKPPSIYMLTPNGRFETGRRLANPSPNPDPSPNPSRNPNPDPDPDPNPEPNPEPNPDPQPGCA